MNKAKRYYLDWIRIVAVFCVFYTHIIVGPAISTDISATVGNVPVEYPFVAVGNWLYRVEFFFIHRGTISGAVGVVLFLWLGGYLAAMTRAKYTSKQFMLKRLCRIIPGVFISTVIICVLKLIVGLPFVGFFRMIASCFSLHPFMGLEPVISVIWTLVVELLFTVYCSIVPRLTFKNIVITELIFIFFVSSYAITGQGSYVFWMYAKYLPIMFVGIFIYETEKERSFSNIIKLVVVASLGYLELYISITHIYTEETAYIKLWTYLAPAIVWLIFVVLNKIGFGLVMRSWKPVEFLVSISLVFYLLQIDVGTNIEYQLKRLEMNNYLVLLLGVVLTMGFSAVVHYFMEKPLQKCLTKKINI